MANQDLDRQVARTLARLDPKTHKFQRNEIVGIVLYTVTKNDEIMGRIEVDDTCVANTWHAEEFETEWHDTWEKILHMIELLRKYPPDRAAKRAGGRKPKYTMETMCNAVIGWRELQTRPRRTLDDDLGEDGIGEPEPEQRMTRQEYLANTFSNGDLSNQVVAERNFDQWAQNFDTGKWDIPSDLRDTYNRLKEK